MTIEECRKFADKFLKCTDTRIYKTDYNQFVGELTYAILRALPKYEERKGAKLGSYLYSVCLHRLGRVKAEEKQYYSKHQNYSDMEVLAINTKTAPKILEKEEMRKIVADSSLPSRTKEIVYLVIDDPYTSQAELARRVGLSRERIRQHFESAKQYLAKQNIELE